MLSFLKKLLRPGPVLEPDLAGMVIPAERLRRLRESDQFIVSYPRSGNRWLRMILRDVIVLNRPELTAPPDLKTLIPDLHHDAPDDSALAQFGVSARILKSHNLRDIAGRRMVYIFRNAADALVSYYRFRCQNPQWASTVSAMSLEAFCQTMLPGWIDHMKIAISAAETAPKQVHFIAYEALHTEPARVLRRVVDFLGIAVADEVIARAIEANSFVKNRAKVTEGKGPILRKGRIGSAGEELSAEVLKEVEAVARPLYQRASELAGP